MRLQLNDKQLEKLSDFASNLSMIFFGATIVPVFNGTFEPFVVVLNLLIGFVFLGESLLLIRGE